MYDISNIMVGYVSEKWFETFVNNLTQGVIFMRTKLTSRNLTEKNLEKLKQEVNGFVCELQNYQYNMAPFYDYPIFTKVVEDNGDLKTFCRVHYHYCKNRGIGVYIVTLFTANGFIESYENISILSHTTVAEGQRFSLKLLLSICEDIE